MLKYLCLISVLVLPISVIVSCEKPDTPSAAKAPQDENILRYDVSAPFASLNPAEEGQSGATIVFPLLYSYLFVPDENGTLAPDLAVKWSYDSEASSWTVHLRKDAMFHDRAPVTSRDVKYTFEMFLKSDFSYLSHLIDRISILSDSVFRITLTRNDPQFLQKIWDMDILPRPDERKIDYRNHPIGSGPFRFKYRKGEKEVVLEANEDYYEGRPSLDRIVFYFQPNREKAWTRLLSGETDIAQEISPKNYEITQQYETSYYFDLYPIHWYTILLYNTTDPLFSNAKVRLALSHAIDRQYIIEEILRGHGIISVGPMGVGSPFHNPDVKPTAYDPKKSLRLLKEAGWSHDRAGRLIKDDKRFEFTLLVFEESQIEKRVARYIRICLNELGVKVHLQALPFKELISRYNENNQFQAVLTEFGGLYRDPEGVRSLWCPGLSGRSGAGCFEHPEVTRLVSQALDQTDPEKQKALLYEIDKLIMSLQPGAFLFHKTAIDVMSKRFKLPFPFSLTSNGAWHLKYVSLDPN